MRGPLSRQSELMRANVAQPRCAISAAAATLFAIGLEAGAARALDGDWVRGERAFQRCFACHSINPAESARLEGPTLFKVVGRPAAAVPGYDYSPALRETARSGLVWDAAALDRYLADPEEAVPGTRMSAPPLRDAQERADLIAYLSRSGRWP